MIKSKRKFFLLCTVRINLSTSYIFVKHKFIMTSQTRGTRTKLLLLIGIILILCTFLVGDGRLRAQVCQNIPNYTTFLAAGLSLGGSVSVSSEYLCTSLKGGSSYCRWALCID